MSFRRKTWIPIPPTIRSLPSPPFGAEDSLPSQAFQRFEPVPPPDIHLPKAEGDAKAVTRIKIATYASGRGTILGELAISAYCLRLAPETAEFQCRYDKMNNTQKIYDLIGQNSPSIVDSEPQVPKTADPLIRFNGFPILMPWPANAILPSDHNFASHSSSKQVID